MKNRTPKTKNRIPTNKIAAFYRESKEAQNHLNKGAGYYVNENEILIYEDIDEFWGVGAETFRSDLFSFGGSDVSVKINSRGGDVFEGLAMFNAMRDYAGHITTQIDGLAASIASIVALGGDEVIAHESTHVMIHDPWTFAMGSASDLRKTADVLDKIGETLARIYQQKSGKDLDEIKTLMNDETWFSASEAKDFGLIDEVIEGEASATAAFDLAIYNNVPGKLKKEIEKSLRDAGYSIKEAKAAVSDGLNSLTLRDVDEGNDLESIASMLEGIRNSRK